MRRFFSTKKEPLSLQDVMPFINSYAEVIDELDTLEKANDPTREKMIKQITDVHNHLMSLQKTKDMKKVNFDSTGCNLADFAKVGNIFTMVGGIATNDFAKQIIMTCLTNGDNKFLVELYRHQDGNTEEDNNSIKSLIAQIIDDITQPLNCRDDNDVRIQEINRDEKTITFKDGSVKKLSARMITALQVNSDLKLIPRLLPPDSLKSANFIA